MGARAAAASAALVLLVACTGGDGATRGRAGPAPASTPAPVPTTVPTPPTTGPDTVDPPGSVTLHATGLTLPELAAGGSGMRVLVRPTTPHLTVRRTGGGGAVTACPVATVAGAVSAGCADLVAGRTLDVAAWGVDVRATGPEATLDQVAVTYLPADESVTLVTPGRPAGACATRPCEVSFSLTPPRAGTFSLDSRAGGGRPRLTLSSNSGPGSSISTLATVEGGGTLSISATLDATSVATLAYFEQGPGAVPALTAEILWP